MMWIVLFALFSSAFAQEEAQPCSTEVEDSYLEDCVSQLQAELTDLDNQIRNVENALAALSRRYDANDAQVKSALDALKTEKQAEIDNLRAEITTTTAQLELLETRLAELTAEREAEQAEQGRELQEAEIAECVQRNYEKQLKYEQDKAAQHTTVPPSYVLEDCRPRPVRQTSWRDQAGGSTWNY